MINIKENGMVDARDLYLALKVKTRFSMWFSKSIDSLGFVGQKDFFPFLGKKKLGRPTDEYDLTIDAAKEMAIISFTEKSRDVRLYLIGLSNKVDDGDLLNRDQILYLTKLKTVFKYIENCDEAQKMNLGKFVQEKGESKYIYADFHKMRNSILKLDKETIDKRIKEYCIENERNYTGSSKKDALLFLDKYEVVRNGVWDFLNAAGHKQAMKLAELVKDMMRIENGEMYRKNEDTLFRSKEIGAEIKLLK